MPFLPSQPPATSDPDLRSALDWMSRELESLSQHLAETQELELRPSAVAPLRPREGMIVYADGANWNPGSGEGPYIYQDGAWEPLVQAPVDLTDYMTKTEYDVNENSEVDVAELANEATHAVDADAVPWTGVSGKPSTFPPDAHAHIIGDVTGLQTALDGKSAVGHGHVISDTTGLQTALDGKADTLHGHLITDVLGLQSELDGKQPLDSDLTDVAALTPTNDDVLQRKAGAWTNRSIAQLTTDLGLGSVYQPLDSDLTAIAGLSPTNDDFVQRKSGAWSNRSIAQVLSDFNLGALYQGLDSDLTTFSGLSPADDDVLQRKAGGWTNRTVAQLLADLGLTTGTFVPVIRFGGGTTGITYGVTGVASWTKWGGDCRVNGRFTLSNKGSSTGAATIATLPYTSRNTTSLITPVTMYVETTAASQVGPWQGFIGPNATIITLVAHNLSTGAFSVLTDAAFSNTTLIGFSALYPVE